MIQSERPDVPTMLDLLEQAYQALIERESPSVDEQARIKTVIDDLRWYAGRLGSQRWELQPGPGHWSFAENLWHITEQAVEESASTEPPPLLYFIDHGKEHVGQAAGIIFEIFENAD